MRKIRLHIREILEEHNMTQKELSEMTGIRQAAISAYVREFRDRIELEHIAKIADALEIDDINKIMSIEHIH